MKLIRSSSLTPDDVEGRRLRGNRLRRRGPFSRHIGLRNRDVGNRPHGLAVGAVEHVRERHLPHLDDGFDRPSVDIDVDQDRMHRHVVVPDVVVNELLVPDHLAGLDIQADERVGIQVGAGTMAAVSVVGRRFGGEVHVSQLVIGRERTPHADVAGVVRRSVQPGLVAGLAFARDGVEDPELLAGANVERQDVALDVFLVRAGAALRQRRTDDDHIVGDDRRRTVADLADRIVPRSSGPAA